MTPTPAPPDAVPGARRARGLWLPLLAAAAMAAVTWLGWRAANARELERVAALVESQAASASTHLAARLERLGDELDRGAGRWLGLPALTLTLARVESSILFRDPRVVRVVWLDTALNVRWAFDAAGQSSAADAAAWAARTDPLWSTGEIRSLRLGPALEGPGDATVILGRVPVVVAEGFAGVMLCLYDAGETLRQAADGLGGGFAITVREPGGQPLLELDAAVAAAGWGRGHALEAGAIRLRVETAPTEATLANLQSGLPRLVAVGGLAFALVLALAVRTGQVEGQRARAAAETALLQRQVEARRQAETALEQRALELQRSNQDLERFAHVISHDLRAPLNAIDMNLQLLEEGPDAAPRRVARARDGVRRMVTMIDGLLEYARVGGARDARAVDAGIAAAEAVSNLEARARDSGAEITIDDLPVLVAVPDQLVRLFQNLIGNALQHRGDARPFIRVRAEPQAAHWLIKVSDNGPGIGAHQVERIFSLFACEGDGAGSGIGLAVCRRIVESNGGHIWVQSEPGAGTTFIFTWPRPTRRP